MAKQALKLGTKVKYLDENGKDAVGRIHAVSTVETPGGIALASSYQIDTGEDERVDEFVHDERDLEIGRQIDAINREAGETLEPGVAFAEVMKNGDLPKSKKIVTTQRHPVLVSVPADMVEAI